MLSSESLMREAIDLARAHRPSPNPRVGALVVAEDGTVLGRGAHHIAGGPHAEVLALAEAGERARGATLIVTLEPCAHQGRTAPCVEAILRSGVARVVYAMPDPNPVAAGGAQLLKAAGVTVEAGVLAEESERLNRAWLHSLRVARPYVIWKVAATLDGRTAAADGSSTWITGEAARADVQRLRAEVDAIVTGTGTALADNPRLDVRIPVERQPLRVLVGDRGISVEFHLAAPDVVRFPTGDPTQVLKVLHEQGTQSVLLECGPTLAGAFMRAGVIDEIVAYIAPALLGEGRPMLDALGVDSISEIRRLDLCDVTVIGSDIRITATVGA